MFARVYTAKPQVTVWGWGGRRTRKTKAPVLEAHCGVVLGGDVNSEGPDRSRGAGLCDEGEVQGVDVVPMLCLKVVSTNVWLGEMNDQRLARGQGCQECPLPALLVTLTVSYSQTGTTPY